MLEPLIDVIGAWAFTIGAIFASLPPCADFGSGETARYVEKGESSAMTYSHRITPEEGWLLATRRAKLSLEKPFSLLFLFLMKEGSK